jgi:thiol-disulfide isomerase/thioredoxin
MYLIRIFLLTAFCALFSNIEAQNLYIINKSNKEVSIEHTNLLEIGTPPYYLAKSSKVQTIPLNNYKPTMLGVAIVPDTGVYGSKDYIFYLFKPNDTVTVEENSNKQPLVLHISSKRRSDELIAGLNILNGVKSKPLYTMDDAIKKANILNSFSYHLKARNHIIDSLSRPIIQEVDIYCNANKIDDEVKQLYKLNYIGALYYDKLTFEAARDIQHRNNEREFYKDSLKKWVQLFDNDNCINVSLYKWSIYTIMNLICLKCTPQQFLDTATILKGNTRDFVISKYMNKLLRKNQKEAERLMPRFNELCQNQQFKDLIKSEFEFSKTKIGKNVSTAYLMDENKRQISFNDLIAKFKNKLIYIDFWASWCMPCVQEMPYSNTLRNKLANNPNIKFVYLSLDASFSNWESSNKANNLNKQSSYILTKYAVEVLQKKLGINLNTIPRYIIINKNGIIINKDAQRPSDDNTYNTLVKLSK